MLTKIKTVFLFSVLINNVSAQNLDWKPLDVNEALNVYKQINKLYSQTHSYEFTLHYASYADYSTSDVYEQSSGFFRKFGDTYHSSMVGIETIQNDKYKIVIDSSNKFLSVSNPDTVFRAAMSIVDYQTMFQYGVSIKTAVSGTEKHYRIEFKDTYPIKAYEYNLAKTGWITEMTIFYNKEIVNENGISERIKPRLKISFTNLKTDIKARINEFNEGSFFIKDGYKIILTGKYKDYKLSDLRIIPN